ncbi:MAG: M23 family metallopeptidase [Candidatus Fonsibacter ubiquis]|nr:M23 family metallopeptidase [Candidatus Fonsibacter ubiquis]
MRFLIIFFLLFNSSLANSFEINGEIIQGALIIGKEHPDKTIYINKQQIKLSKNGIFVFGINYNQTGDIVIESVDKNNQKISKTYNEKMVTPDQDSLEIIKKENDLIKNAQLINSDFEFFFSGFNKPVDGVISGIYGSQRILNGKPRSPHLGIDYAVPKGTEIKSPADGYVSLAERGFYFTGDSIILDHGHGVSTIYAHLDEILVKKGDFIKKGQIIGKVGSTGRATGPHLHFGMNWFGTKIDPELILK